MRLFDTYQAQALPRIIEKIRRKNVHDFVIRYGAYAALVDDTESLDELLARLEEVEQDEFLFEGTQTIEPDLTRRSKDTPFPFSP